MFKKLIILFIFLIICSVANADIPIYCPKCRTYLYNYIYDDVNFTKYVDITEFRGVGVIEDPRHSRVMICPICTAPLDGYSYWFYSRGLKLPRMVYYPWNFLTKDKSGKFKWIPDEVDLTE